MTRTTSLMTCSLSFPNLERPGRLGTDCPAGQAVDHRYVTVICRGPRQPLGEFLRGGCRLARRVTQSVSPGAVLRPGAAQVVRVDVQEHVGLFQPRAALLG